jgi:hypothetical protein
LALLVAGAAFGAYAPAVVGRIGTEGTPAPAGAACAVEGGVAAAEPWLRQELFFGTAKPDGTAVSEAEWQAFLDREITPRFPDGLTVLTGYGQFQADDGTLIQERSMLLILLVPPDAAADSGRRIEEIRTAYEQQFRQQSVLRADHSGPVCVSF